MKVLAHTILQTSTGTTFISVKDLITFLNQCKASENDDVCKFIDEMIVAFATMKTEQEYK
jgi:hypothetical protein